MLVVVIHVQKKPLLIKSHAPLRHAHAKTTDSQFRFLACYPLARETFWTLCCCLVSSGWSWTNLS